MNKNRTKKAYLCCKVCGRKMTAGRMALHVKAGCRENTGNRAHRKVTTTSPLVAARGINNGTPVIRLRDTASGRFISWEEGRSIDFGRNGSSPTTYYHADRILTFRSNPAELKSALWHQRYANGESKFLTSEGIIQDRKFIMAWRDEDADEELGAWDIYFVLDEIVFELY